MSAFKKLRDQSIAFEAEIRSLSADLFCAKIQDTFEEKITKKLQDLTLFTSKLRLLRGKSIADNPQIAEQVRNEHMTLDDYEDTTSNKVLEQQIVKFLMQSHAVQNLITAPNKSLHPELVDRKERIIEAMTSYANLESQLFHMNKLLTEKEAELREVRLKWDEGLGCLRDMRDRVDGSMDTEPSPLYMKLKALVDKMEMMRWLISKLVTSRSGGYDWVSDPHNRFRALKIAREDNSIEKFIES
ncbi:hypothetical protein ACJJTC_001697 [Scirpophaga incertulas]